MHLTTDETAIMEAECETYNEHIRNLLHGTAPDESYAHIEDKYKLSEVYHNRGHDKKGEPLFSRGYYRNSSDFYPEFMVIAKEDCEDYDWTEAVDADLMSAAETCKTITMKFDSSDEFGMGLAILPLTDRLLSQV